MVRGSQDVPEDQHPGTGLLAGVGRTQANCHNLTNKEEKGSKMKTKARVSGSSAACTPAPQYQTAGRPPNSQLSPSSKGG